jgi:hypothetical protein
VLGTKVIAKKSNGLSESSANGNNPLCHVLSAYTLKTGLSF